MEANSDGIPEQQKSPAIPADGALQPKLASWYGESA